MKNKRVHKIFSSIVFVILLIVAIAKCSDILEYKEAREKYTPFYESKTNFDVLLMGSSHMWNHVLPMELWENYGISSYNWGYSNCTPAENYYLLQDILKYTSPKVVVLDAYGLIEYEKYGNGKYRNDRMEQQHVQFDSLPLLAKGKLSAVRDVFNNYANREDFIWNFIMYHNRWNELDKSDFEYDLTTEKGAQFLTGLGTTNASRESTTKKTKIQSACYPYYLKIIEYCEKKDIKVLCTYIPYAAGEEQKRIANTLGDIVTKYPNCSYVNMLPENIIDYDTDLCLDNSHLNYSGANKVTSWLGNYLSNNYELDDYSSDDSWKKDYQNYFEYKQSELKKQELLVSYLVQLRDSDFRAEAEIYDKKLMESERLMKLYSNAEITPIYKQNDGTKCAKLIIRKADTGEIVDTVEFSYNKDEKFDIFKLKRS